MLAAAATGAEIANRWGMLHLCAHTSQRVLQEDPLDFPRTSRRFSVLAVAFVAACGGGDKGGTTPTPTPAGFTVSLSSATLSAVVGGNASITATIARTGSFTGTVDLSTESVPAGVMAVFNPAQVTSGTTQTTLTVTAFATAVPGAYTFTIRGKATGLTDQTATVSMTVTAAPRIGLALAPATGSVVQGATTSFTATITRTNFTGAVAVAIGGAPSGVTTTVTTTGDASTVNVAVGAAAAVGVTTLTVTASGTGVANATATYVLTVTAAPSGSFTLALSPAALSVQQGANGQTTVNITRTNFTSAIALSITGAPAGVSTAFGQSNLPTESTTPLTITVGGTVAAAVYPLIVTATSGAISQTSTLSLTVTAAPAGSISLALAAAIPSIQQGSSDGVNVNITRANYTGAVTLAVTGTPPGVTTTITPNSTTTNQSLVSFAVGAATVPGSYGVTITGSGTNIPSATVTGTLVVTATPSIALSLTPAAGSVQAGGSLTFTVNIVRTNFSAPVTIAVSNAPAGVTTTVTTSPTTGNAATVNVAVSGSTALGLASLTVTASGTGVSNAIATFALTVTQPPVSGGNVTYTFGFCGTTQRPIWVAAQDGSGPWQQVTGSANSYSFTITARGGVAFVTQGAGANEFALTLFYASLAELQGQGSTVCPTAPTKTVNGTVAGLNAAAFGQGLISLGGSSASVSAPATTFTLNGVRDGALDLVAARLSINLTTFAPTTDKLIIRRGVNVPSGTTLPVLDFNGAEAFDPEQKTVTVTGTNGEMVSISSFYITGTQSSAFLGSDLPAASTTRPFYAVPTAKQAAGDLHLLSASATVINGSTLTSLRSSSIYFKNAVDQTLPLGATLLTPTFSTIATTPYLRPRVVLAQQADYNRFWLVSYSQSSGGVARTATISMTEGYLGSAAFDHSMPDFSGVSGWLNTWGLQSGTAVNYFVTSVGWTLIGGGSGAPILEGSVFRSAARFGVVP